MIDNFEFGEMLKTFRKNKGITQEKLAERTGLSVMSIRRYENDERKISFESTISILRALGFNKEDMEIMFGIRVNRELTKAESILVDNYVELNEDGKNKLMQYGKDLSDLQKYNRYAGSTCDGKSIH